jgi:sugar phosphate isomerase/epimerase
MKLVLVRHLWGVDHSRGLDHYLPDWRKVGYEAIESAFHHSPNQPALLQFLKTSGWKWIAQVFSREFVGGGTVREHLESFRCQVEDCLRHRPWFINAHTGSDSWMLAEAEDFYAAALDIEKKLGIAIAHETHRMRCLGNPWTTRAILERFPTLKITCDFSHWVCVAERLLEDCEPIIRLAAEHSFHVHARVGYEESPQVPDPRAPEWTQHVLAHERWWDIIWASQKRRGLVDSTLTPEFGPAPYLHSLPYTRVPVTDLAAVCDWQARRQADRFSQGGY